MSETIHFHSGDERFCGSRAQGRRFTMDAGEVTCGGCKSRDRLALTPEAAAYVAWLEGDRTGPNPDADR